MELKFALGPSSCGCNTAIAAATESGPQQQPMTYVVGTTPGAPTAGTSIWNLAAFGDSWVVLIIGRSTFVDMSNVGDGSAYITKTFGAASFTINNYVWQTGDILSYILIRP